MEQIGRYQLVRRLATGGMAEVFLARAEGPRGFEKQLVIKRILPHLAETPKFVELFLAEARIAARLSHPNIAQVFDLGEADGVPYLAMEYVDGPSLRGVLQRAGALGRPLPAVLCAQWVSLICDGLSYAHAFCDPDTGDWLGLIHRDISPENVLVSMSGSVKVVDFGIAKAAGLEPSKSASIRGKYAYMAPEQLKSQGRLDGRADVFATGVVLYELLTGHKPFAARGELEMMRAIVFDPHLPASARRADVPAALEAVIARALQKDRDQRYPHSRALREDLEAFLRDANEDTSAYRTARLIKSLDAIPRTPTGSVFPVMLPGVVHTRSSPTRIAAAGLIAAGAPTPSAEHSAPDGSAVTPPEANATRVLGHGDALPTPETRLFLEWTAEPELKPLALAPSKLGPVLLGIALLTAAAGLMSARWLLPRLESAWTRTAALPPASAATPAGTPAAPLVEGTLQPARIRVRSEPPAELWIDGVRVGVGEVQVEGHRPGALELRAVDPQRRFEKSARLTLLPGDNGEHTLVVGTALVDLRVPGKTTVFIDGRPAGVSPLQPLELFEGEHTVRLHQPHSGREATFGLTVVAGEPMVVTHPLDP